MSYYRYNPTSRLFQIATDPTDPETAFTTMPLDAGQLTHGTLPFARVSSYRFPRTLVTQNGANSTVGATPLTLMSYTMVAGQFTNGDCLHGTLHGNWAANANTKQIFTTFDGTTVLALGPQAINSNRWFIEYWIYKVLDNSCQWYAFYETNSTSGQISGTVSGSKAGIDFSANNYVITTVATGVSNGDITRGPCKLILEAA